ncbi:MAG: thiamine phosphate synthase [Planctomycetota bacterium]
MKVTPSVLRILDANGNRAIEAVRVIEESLRFSRNDALLSRECKALRHHLCRHVEVLRVRHGVEVMRDTSADVGVDIQGPNETHRASLTDLVMANFSRLKEALRCLEEYTKLVDVELAGFFEGLRYEAYELERAMRVTMIAEDRLANVQIYALVDADETFESRVRELAKRVDAIQLLYKRLDDATLLLRARQLVEICRGKCLSIINDRCDIGLLAGADGVHVGQEDLPVADARRLCGPQMIVGASTHSIEQARQAVLAGATYIGVGPVFPSGTKTFEEFPGLDLVSAVAGEINRPAFAIGGINGDNIQQVVQAGLNRVAVSGALAEDAATTLEAMRAALGPRPEGGTADESA